MSTTTPTGRLVSQIGLAAAADVIVGGLTAIGVAVSQDGTTAPTHSRSSVSTMYAQKCAADPRCFPPSHQRHVAERSSRSARGHIAAEPP